MPLPRMTTRRWMIAVAIAAVALLGVRLWQLRVEYQLTAQRLAAREAATRARAEWATKMLQKGYVSRSQEATARAEAEQAASTRRIHQQSARRLWFLVVPE